MNILILLGIVYLAVGCVVSIIAFIGMAQNSTDAEVYFLGRPTPRWIGILAITAIAVIAWPWVLSGRVVEFESEDDYE